MNLSVNRNEYKPLSIGQWMLPSSQLKQLELDFSTLARGWKFSALLVMGKFLPGMLVMKLLHVTGE